MGEEFGHDDSEKTGHPVVDAVLDSLDGIGEVPAASRVRLFESAHDALRSVLADAGNESTPSPPAG